MNELTEAGYWYFDIIINALSMLGTILIAFILFRLEKDSKRQAYANEVKNLWSQIDSVVLSNDNLLRQADLLIHPDKEKDSLEVKQRRWICYMLQNVASVTYAGIDKKLVPDWEKASMSLEKTLAALLKTNEYNEISEYCHDGPLISKYEELRKKV